MFVPAVSCHVSLHSAVSTLTLEVRRFLCGLFTVTFFAFLATFLALAEFPFHVGCRLEDASAPQVIFCRGAPLIEDSQFFNVQLVCLQWFQRVRNDARLCHVVRNLTSSRNWF